MVRSHINAPWLGTLAALALSLTAHGQIWNEAGDAGQNGVGAAQITVGAGTLTTINGSLFAETEVDMYCIRITNEAAFSAVVTSSAGVDSVLWLFNTDGTLQVWNDDTDAGNALSTLNSNGVLANGTYFLAISNWYNDPRTDSNFTLTGDASWSGTGPSQGQGNGLVLSGWAGSSGGIGTEGPYTIALQGAEFYLVPAPGAAAMLALGGLMAAAGRRRTAR